MDKFVTDGTSGPSAPQHRLVPVEILSAHSAEAWFYTQQHRFPFTTGFSYAHSGRSIAGQPTEKQGERNASRTLARFSPASTWLILNQARFCPITDNLIGHRFSLCSFCRFSDDPNINKMHVRPLSTGIGVPTGGRTRGRIYGIGRADHTL